MHCFFCFARAFPDSLELFLIPINHCIYFILLFKSVLIVRCCDAVFISWLIVRHATRLLKLSQFFT